MSRDRGQPLPTSKEELMEARRRIAGQSADTARAEYRARLRTAFVQGELQPLAPVRRSPRPLFFWGGGLLAAAATILLLLRALLPAEPGPPWLVAPGIDRSVSVVADGQALTLPADAAALRETLRDGGLLALPDSLPLSLTLDRRLAVQLAPGSRVRLPGVRAGWPSLAVVVEEGEARFTSGAAFKGRTLIVTTAESVVEVTGTTIAVIADSSGTCVCVLEGAVRVGRGGVASSPLAAGFRVILDRDGGPPVQEPIRPMEAMKLSMFRDQLAPELGADPR